MEKQIYNKEAVLANFSSEDADVLTKAFALITQLDKPEAIINKSYQVALILNNINVDINTVVAAVLASPGCSLSAQENDINELFGDSVVLLLNDVNNLNKQHLYSKEISSQPSQAETLRRMLLSMIEDVRTVLIRLAYRIVRLRNLGAEAYDMRHFIAQETLDIYAPIANRLGVSQLKWELEDLAFRYLQPQNYLKLVKSLDATRNQREEIINSFVNYLQGVLDKQNITAEIAGRPKHIYSIWKKMQRKDMTIDELYDLLAVRVLVNELSDCYAVLGVIHGQWQYIPNEFDDYVSNPKANGYQSLHTVIVNPQGHRIEIQIRTKEMHEYSELGVAAHWRYKEGSNQNAATEKTIASLRQLLTEKESDEELVAGFNTELFYDRVYVLSPAGKLIDLIKGSTPLDFAYAIHTEVGHRCRGAKVNGRIVPLTYILQTGEQVEILTAKEGGPNHHWIDSNLGYLKNPRSFNKVKSWFKQQDVEKNVGLGKQILDREIQHLRISDVNLIAIQQHFKKPDIDQLYLAIGRGDISTPQITGYFTKPEPGKHKANKTKPEKATILVDGLSNVVSTIAPCCCPVVGDKIVGYISYHKGIRIHRVDCENIINLSRNQQTQLISVSWNIES